VETGKIDLDADANQYLPFELRNPKHPEIPITIEMLMRHESSIASMMDLYLGLYVDGDSEMRLEDLCLKVFDIEGEYYKTSNFEDYPPGEKWGYRNWNYVLLGYIVERVTGAPFYAYSYENVLKPLEMYSARWFLKELELDDLAVHYQLTESGEHSPVEFYGWPGYPDGQLRASVRELANLLIMYLNDGEFGGKRLLTRNSISRMFTTKEYADLTGKSFNGMGLAWFVNAGHVSVYSHGGSPTGTRVDVLIDRETNSGFVFYATGIDEMKIWTEIKELLHDLQKYAAGQE
jgi:CubicO group peptidase (beta-lactamase class C family)